MAAAVTDFRTVICEKRVRPDDSNPRAFASLANAIRHAKHGYRHRLGPGIGRRLASKPAFGTASQCISRVFLALAWPWPPTNPDSPLRAPSRHQPEGSWKVEPHHQPENTISPRRPAISVATTTLLHHSPLRQLRNRFTSARRIRTIAAD